MASDWPLMTDGRYSEVIVRTGLTVDSSTLKNKIRTLANKDYRVYFQLKNS
jgi:hypothetical protein